MTEKGSQGFAAAADAESRDVAPSDARLGLLRQPRYNISNSEHNNAEAIERLARLVAQILRRR